MACNSIKRRPTEQLQGTSYYDIDLYNILDHGGDGDDMCKRFNLIALDQNTYMYEVFA